MRRSRRGFTLIETMVTVAVAGILAALSVSYLSSASPRSRLTGSARELNANVAAAKSHAYSRGVRVGLLINTASAVDAEHRVRYWLVTDPWSTLDEAMAANNSWQTPGELVPQSPAPAGAVFPSLDAGGTTMERHVGLPADFLVGETAVTGFRGAVPRSSPPAYEPCTSAGDIYRLRDGSAAAANFFPPPFCMVPVGGCTFCSSGRGAVFFEPDGQVRLVNHAGATDGLGAGSVTLAAAGIQDVLSLVFTSSGLVRTF